MVRSVSATAAAAARPEVFKVYDSSAPSNLHSWPGVGTMQKLTVVKLLHGT